MLDELNVGTGIKRQSKLFPKPISVNLNNEIYFPLDSLGFFDFYLLIDILHSNEELLDFPEISSSPEKLPKDLLEWFLIKKIIVESDSNFNKTECFLKRRHIFYETFLLFLTNSTTDNFLFTFVNMFLHIQKTKDTFFSVCRKAALYWDLCELIDKDTKSFYNLNPETDLFKSKYGNEFAKDLFGVVDILWDVAIGELGEEKEYLLSDFCPFESQLISDLISDNIHKFDYFTPCE